MWKEFVPGFETNSLTLMLLLLYDLQNKMTQLLQEAIFFFHFILF